MSVESAMAARITDTSPHRPIPVSQARRLAQDGQVYVTYGQSNATSSGAPGYEVSKPVFMVFEGQAYPFVDPALGGTGPGGSVWGRLGDRLVSQGTEAVFFSSAGFGGATLQELAVPPHLEFLVAEIRATKSALGRIDAVLIHQGESNHRALRGAGDYAGVFETLLAAIRQETDAPVYFSLATICNNQSDLELLGKQAAIIRKTPGVLRGPNTDLLRTADDRLPDGCHFSAGGLDAFADLWVEALDAQSEE